MTAGPVGPGKVPVRQLSRPSAPRSDRLDTMLGPTLPEARYLILDDADLSSLVSIAMASERWGGKGPAPVLAPAWWRPDADDAMPLVHRATGRHAALFGMTTIPEELVVEPREEPGGAGVISQLLLAASQMAARSGCDAVLFPVRAADLNADGRLTLPTLAREVDRAELIGRLATLDSGEPRSIATPLVDFDDEQLIDLAQDLGVPVEACWWAGRRGEPGADAATQRWRALLVTPTGREQTPVPPMVRSA